MTTLRRSAAPATALALALVLLVGCSASTGPTPPATGADPRLEVVECPSDVEILVVPTHTCAFVVTTSRSGDEHKIFVLSVDPPVPNDLPPVLETGTDLGLTPTYGGLAPIAQRTGRRLVLVDLPGTGHSTPSLDCPELEALAVQPSADEVRGAVDECRHRLEGDGVDVTDVTPAALGDVLHDVTLAFGLPRWVVMGHGTSGIAALDLAREHPETVEALVLDSVLAGDPDPGQSLDKMVEEIAVQCRATRGCVRAHGDPSATWARAQTRLARQPIEVSVANEDVAIDDVALAHAVRWLVAWSAFGPNRLIELLAEAASGRAGTLLAAYAGALTAAPPLCVGYLPRCESDDQVSMGAVLSTVCPGLADSRDWSGACAAWGVGSDPVAPTPLTQVPVLALFGRFDPFAPPGRVRADFARLAPDAHLVEVPSGSHNVLGDECVRAIRNAWLAGAFDDPPALPPCLTTQLTFD